jgi:lysophospholipase L1-like esterase
VPSFTDRHSTGLLIALLTALALVAGVTAALTGRAGDAGDAGAPGQASGEPSGSGATYLALGDSVAFGYRGHEADYSDPAAFVGYPQLVAGDLHLDLLDASCPGETTGSFADPDAQSNGCENSVGSPLGYRDGYPLHTYYTGSQLQYAVDTLRSQRQIRLVTLQLGANDAFVCRLAAQDYCTSGTDIAGIAGHVAANLDRILGTLRTEGHYTGRIVVVTYYALDYSDPVGAAGTQLLDTAIAGAAKDDGAVVADGFAALQAQAGQAGGNSVTAGLVLPNDVHPTRLGQQLLARAVEQAAGQ